jgi:hypothetical protein
VVVKVIFFGLVSSFKLPHNGRRLGEGGGSLLFGRATNFQVCTNVSASYTATFAKPLVSRSPIFINSL